MDLLSKLQSEFGDVVSPCAAAEWDAADGVQPQAVAAPRDEEAAQALVTWCGRENIAFVPRGGGSKLHIGAPPTRCDLIISTEDLTQIFDHDEGNATVQAGAGIRLEDLDAEMKKRGQFVPLENEGAATLGGVTATNSFRGSKLKYGAPRDLVTGLHAVLSDGRLVKSGAKVVKNVAGYDLNKLFTGSFGTLGLITQVTIRLRPVAPQQAVWSCDFDTWDAAEKQSWDIVRGAFEPTFLTVYWDPLTCILLTRFEGGEATVQRQLSELPAARHSDQLMNLPVTYELRAQLPLQNAPVWARQAQEHEAASLAWECGLGVVRASFERECGIAALRAMAEKLGGFLVVEKAPHEVKTPDLVWGAPRGDFALMKKIKQAFDAASVCAPGRFIGGL